MSGGGTGGHVYPALEVAREAVGRGWEVVYLGSLRGMEGAACQAEGLAFEGFPVEPVVSLKRPKGWIAVIRLFRASGMAKRRLVELRPDFVFATGGYSAAPVLRAAQALEISVGLHEQNSVPGRTILMAGKKAAFVATVFRTVERHLAGCNVVRTGMPIRKAMRDVADGLEPGHRNQILVVGGSQGATALNEAALATGARMTRADAQWTHVCGRTHFDEVFHTHESLGLGSSYTVRAFLDETAMAAAYRSARIVVGRSGAGTLSELAAFRLRSILVPFPFAFAQHQLHNAREFEAMGAAKVLTQDRLQPSSLESEIETLLDSSDTSSADDALRDWDIPNAAQRIADLIAQNAR